MELVSILGEKFSNATRNVLYFQSGLLGCHFTLMTRRFSERSVSCFISSKHREKPALNGIILNTQTLCKLSNCLDIYSRVSGDTFNWIRATKYRLPQLPSPLQLNIYFFSLPQITLLFQFTTALLLVFYKFYLFI